MVGSGVAVVGQMGQVLVRQGCVVVGQMGQVLRGLDCVVVGHVLTGQDCGTLVGMVEQSGHVGAVCGTKVA